MCLQHSIPMADDGVGDGIFLLTYFRMLLYQKQNIQGCTPDQAGHSYQLYIYDTLHLSKRIHISVYNGEIRPAPGQKRLVMVVIPMVKNSFFFITFLFRRRSPHFQSPNCVVWRARHTDHHLVSHFPLPKNLHRSVPFLRRAPL